MSFNKVHLKKTIIILESTTAIPWSGKLVQWQERDYCHLLSTLQTLSIVSFGALSHARNITGGKWNHFPSVVDECCFAVLAPYPCGALLTKCLSFYPALMSHSHQVLISRKKHEYWKIKTKTDPCPVGNYRKCKACWVFPQAVIYPTWHHKWYKCFHTCTESTDFGGSEDFKSKLCLCNHN